MGKQRLKQRLLILDRAYDKAVKGQPLAELEGKILQNAIQYSAQKEKVARKTRRDSVWKHFGWDTPEGKAKWQKISEEIRHGKSV